MRLKGRTWVVMAMAYLGLCAFQLGKPTTGAKATCKDGTMEVRDTTCGESVSKRFVFGTDTLDLPFCSSYPCSGSMWMEFDSITDRSKIVSTVKHRPEKEPFYFRKEVFIYVGLTKEQEGDFDWFKQQVYNGVKDTGLRAELWFELNSTESAMKNDDAASYVIGVRHLTETWAKISPSQFFDK